MDQLRSWGTPLDGPVTADAVEDALAASWRRVRSTRDPGYPVVRASVLSLIVCVAEPSATDRAFDAIRNLSRLHPSRTIILLPDGYTHGEDVRIWHSTGCAGGDDRERVVCGEQVVIAARGKAISFLPSLTDQLMLTDLPSFLWWVGDVLPPHDTLFDHLTRLADRLVVDSSDFVDLGASLARLDQLAHRRHQPCFPSDLNWARLTPWRELVAQFFDSPALRPHLFCLDEISVDYGSVDGSGFAQTVLLVGWIASQLGWQLDLSAQRVRLRRADGCVVSIATRSIAEASVPGLLQVALRADGTAIFKIARESDRAQALTEADIAGAPALRRIARFESGDLSSLLADELVLFQRDRVYEAVLRLAVQLSDRLGAPNR
jgi:glucose-6-phosphate dehydrogenase assembly protein OpcA